MYPLILLRVRVGEREVWFNLSAGWFPAACWGNKSPELALGFNTNFIIVIPPMRRRGSSRTAELAAMTRTLATHSTIASGIMNDPFARYFLGPSLQVPYFFNRLFLDLNPWFWRRGINSVGFLIALCRHRFMRDTLEENLRQGIGQVVILGAGYDTNILREPDIFKSAKVFEVDHPNTQKRKRKILDRNSLAIYPETQFVPHDLETGNLTRVLIDCGLDREQEVFVIAEGIISYLSINSIDRLFMDLFDLSDGNVRIAADYRLPQINTKNVPFTIRRWRNEFKMMNERYRSFFSANEIEQKLMDHGFRIKVNRNMIDLWKEYSMQKPPDHLRQVAGIVITEKMSPHNMKNRIQK
ncbi:MAG: class I SAM-dependent methyltransferase [Bacteroidales bacterium]|nr:MAG: class I SAM-dependent methyltransferase [Bacteroidales bacterium]